MKKILSLILAITLSCSWAFAQTNGFDSSATTPGGTRLTIVATFPTPTNLDKVITTAKAELTWHDQHGSTEPRSLEGVFENGVFKFYDWTPLGASPLWVTYKVEGLNGDKTFGWGTSGTYYLQSYNDVLYITNWQYQIVTPPPPPGG